MIGNKIAQLRKAKNLSQEELADKLNVTRQTISRWEQETVYPTLENCVEICRIFEIPVRELLEDDFEIKDQEGLKQLKKYLNIALALCGCLILVVILLVYKNAKISQQLETSNKIIENYEMKKTYKYYLDKDSVEILGLEDKYQHFTDLLVRFKPNEKCENQIYTVKGYYPDAYYKNDGMLLSAEAQKQEDGSYLAVLKNVSIHTRNIMIEVEHIEGNEMFIQRLPSARIIDEFYVDVAYFAELIVGNDEQYLHVESRTFPLKSNAYKNLEKMKFTFKLYYEDNLIDYEIKEYDIQQMLSDRKNILIATANFDWDLTDERYKNTENLSLYILCEFNDLVENTSSSGSMSASYNSFIEAKDSVRNYYDYK